MTAFDPGRPSADEHAPYHAAYLKHVPDGDILGTLRRQVGQTLALLGGLSDGQAMTRQAPYSWTIKEVVGHLADTERILGYRALRFARGDQTPLPGFEQDDYVKYANSDAVPLDALADEFRAVRESSLRLFGNLPPDAWLREGRAFDTRFTVHALAYIIAGHEGHHLAILRERVKKLAG